MWQVLVLGGGGTVNEVVHGLYSASARLAEEPSTSRISQSPSQAPEPLHMPIGVVPEGNEVREPGSCARCRGPRCPSLEIADGAIWVLPCSFSPVRSAAQNVLYATVGGSGGSVAAGEEQAVCAMLRLARMRRAPLPLLLCQADDGVVMPVLSNGACVSRRMAPHATAQA